MMLTIHNSPEKVLHGSICNMQDIISFNDSFAVVFRRFAMFLPTNSIVIRHRKHLRIRRATFISWPFLFRFILSLNNPFLKKSLDLDIVG